MERTVEASRTRQNQLPPLILQKKRSTSVVSQISKEEKDNNSTRVLDGWPDWKEAPRQWFLSKNSDPRTRYTAGCIFYSQPPVHYYSCVPTPPLLPSFNMKYLPLPIVLIDIGETSICFAWKQSPTQNYFFLDFRVQPDLSTFMMAWWDMHSRWKVKAKKHINQRMTFP